MGSGSYQNLLATGQYAIDKVCALSRRSDLFAQRLLPSSARQKKTRKPENHMDLAAATAFTSSCLRCTRTMRIIFLPAVDLCLHYSNLNAHQY